MSLALSRIIAITLFIIVGTFLGLTHQAEAAFGIPTGGVDLTGFAWSGYDTNSDSAPDAGVGWISMNCSNTDTCVGGSGVGPKVDYAVRLQDDGSLSGYAWSSNIGWINFDPTGAFPATTGYANQTAGRTSGTFPNVIFGGWARACSATANPDTTCSGGMNTNAGGWDGWISLGTWSTAPVPFNVTMSSGREATANSFAWGGSVVMGWIDFSPVGAPPVRFKLPDNPVVTFTCPSDPISTDDDVVCNYDPTGGGPPDTCTLTDSAGGSQNLALAAGTVTLSPNETTTYTLICTSPGGPSDPEEEPIVVYPDLEIVNLNATLSNQNRSTGEYGVVEVIFEVEEIPVGTDVGYVVALGSETQTGQVTGTGPVEVAFTNVGFSLAPVIYTVQVDGSPNQGVVQEDVPPYATGLSTPDNEDYNFRQGEVMLAPPNPEITIEVTELVPTGTSTDVVVTVTAPYDTTCQLFGPGFGDTSSEFTVLGGTEYTNTFTSAALTNSTNIAVRCDVPSGVPFSHNESVEVTPTFQER